MSENLYKFDRFEMAVESLLALWEEGKVVTVGIGIDPPRGVYTWGKVDYIAETFDRDTFNKCKLYVIDELEDEFTDKIVDVFRVDVNYGPNGFVITSTYYTKAK